jgi:hypothetical protein
MRWGPSTGRVISSGRSGKEARSPRRKAAWGEWDALVDERGTCLIEQCDRQLLPTLGMQELTS